MKKSIILLSFFLTSCGCILSQNIPPQNLFPGVNCTAPVPDYRPFFTITGGCTGFTVLQTPAPGTILSTSNSPIIITVKATGTNGKSSQRSFTVALADTITPKLTPIGILAEIRAKQINDLYDAGDKLVGSIESILSQQVWIDSIPGLRSMIIDSAFYKKVLVHTSFQRIDGSRVQFTSFADSVKLIDRINIH